MWMHFLLEWIELAVRWTHVITAVAWIGSSFYFIALDLGLLPSNDRRLDVSGEAWQVHGGGFYNIQKYMVAPTRLPKDLTWFKWESYATWMSGFALLAVVYYLGADLFLIDPEVMDLSPMVAILISIGSLVFGWLAYNRICSSRMGENSTRLMLLLYVLLVGVAWGYTHIFSGRAALLHVGAFTATIMSANVFLIIIPNQKIVVADLIAQRPPNPKYGQIAKQRSTHNNYLTLPVLFMMLSNHYPLAFASEYNWIIASVVFLMGVSIRHFFNTIHKRGKAPWWAWGLTAGLFGLIVWLSTMGIYRHEEAGEDAALAPQAQLHLASADFEEVYDLIAGNCSMCHAKEPLWDGIVSPPKGILLETEAQIATHAKEVWLSAGLTNAMPPANLTGMDTEARLLIRRWYEGAL